MITAETEIQHKQLATNRLDHIDNRIIEFMKDYYCALTTVDSKPAIEIDIDGKKYTKVISVS